MRYTHALSPFLTILLLAACDSGSDTSTAEAPGEAQGTEAASQEAAEADPTIPEEAAEPAVPAITPAVCAGRAFTCVSNAEGAVACFGDNMDGQLGDGTGEGRREPANVVGATGVTALACGNDHVCATQAGGTVVCWGSNAEGEVGDGSTEPRLGATPVSGIADATDVVAGNNFSCALHATGGVSCWGTNSNGVLGNGSREPSAVPVAVNGLSQAVELTAGTNHVCARQADGRAFCWGSDSDGQLGTPGSNSPSNTPVELGLTRVSHIAGGQTNTCAISDAGLSCWGDGYSGQLLNGQSGFEGDAAEPFAIAAVSGPTQVAIADDTICTIVGAGDVHCWGEGDSGQIGNGVSDDVSAPTPVSGIHDATALVAGYRHFCAVRANGALSCWGSNGAGEIAPASGSQGAPYEVTADMGTFTGSPSEVPSFAPIGTIAATPHLSAGDSHVCGVSGEGVPFCWGSNHSGQLGDNSTRSLMESGTTPLGLDGIIAIAAGPEHSCAVRQTGEVACWGRNDGGDGTGREASSTRPVLVSGVTDAVGLGLGRRMTCIVHQTGAVSCFGSSSYAGLGNGTQDSSLTPVPVTGLTDVAQVTSGSSVTCARQNSGAVWCWGSGRDGVVGNGADDRALTPVQVAGLTDAVDVSAYDSNVCAVRADGHVVCWGAGDRGALGNGTTGNDTYSNVPVEVSGVDDAVAVSVGTAAACALRADGALSCWGSNNFGQAGINDTDLDEVLAAREVAVDPANTVLAGYGPRTDVACGRSFCVALHADGHVSGWGTAPGFGSGALGGLAATRSPLPYQIPFVEL